MRITARVYLLITASLVVVQVQAKTASDVFELASKSMVVVYGLDDTGKKQSQGSGVVLLDGVIATNCHVIENSQQYKVKHNRREYSANLRHSDWDRDVCTLAVEGLKAPAIVLGSTSKLKVGARVYAIGAPKGLELTLSEGIVSSLREAEGGQYIQTTAPISPGSSGGGLFDTDARLLGLPTFYLADGQQLNFAVPVEWIKALPEHRPPGIKPRQARTEWLNRAMALQELQDWTALQAHALRWTKASPQDAMSWFALGVAYGEMGHIDRAIESNQQALRINPDYASAWYNLGIDYSKLGQTDKVIEAYQQALRINPDDAAVRNSLGLSYMKMGQFAKAIESFQKALRINPDDAGVWNSLSLAYGESGQLAKSIESLQQVVRIKPDDINDWFFLGVSYKLDGQSGRVLEVYRRLKTLDSKKAEEFFTKVVLP